MIVSALPTSTTAFLVTMTERNCGVTNKSICDVRDCWKQMTWDSEIKTNYFENITAATVTIVTGIVILVGMAAILLRRSEQNKPKKQANPRSVRILDRCGGNVFVSESIVDESGNAHLIGYFDKNVQTMYDAFQNGMKIAEEHGDRRLLGKLVNDEYHWTSYEETLSSAKMIIHNLASLGYVIGPETKIGILSINCPEWMQVAIAAFTHRITLVPLNHYLDDQSISHIIDECKLELIFVNNLKTLDRLISLQIETQIRHVVIFSNETSWRSWPGHENLVVVPFESISELIPNEPIIMWNDYPPPVADDLIIICYTSGSTGKPKGVMLTHKNIMATVAAFVRIFVKTTNPGKEVMLSYLPLSHIFEFVTECMFISHGFKIGYIEKDPRELVKNAQVLKPTFLPMVPRVLNGIHGQLMSKLKTAGFLKRNLFKCAIYMKQKWLDCYDPIPKSGPWPPPKHWLYDYLFRPVQSALGGQVRFILVGGSVPAKEVLSTMKVALGAYVIEGYGQTETSGGTICQEADDFTVGNVGVPIQSVKVKLAPIEGQEGNSKMGEVCVKGHNVFKGYYGKDSQDESFDEDHWFHSGDVAVFNDDGSFSIVDRIKEMFKLSHGEFIAPVKIENIYSESEYVNQCFVHGLVQENFCVAIVTLNVGAVQRDLNLDGQESEMSQQDLCESEDVLQMVSEDMNRIADECKLRTIERVRMIHLCPEPFSIENGLLTATFKLKRFVAIKRFENEINRMYAKTLD